MSHARPALQRLGSEFISGYCSLVEGEKDPRNLMISFNLVKVILLEFDVAKTIEVRSAPSSSSRVESRLDADRVEWKRASSDRSFLISRSATSPSPSRHLPATRTASRPKISSSLSGEFRYYETLRPMSPQADPNVISPLLRNRGCLSATPLLGPLALPLFFDKLQAASEKAKVSLSLSLSPRPLAVPAILRGRDQPLTSSTDPQRQTLQALVACFPIYGAATCGEWAGRFSEALITEVRMRRVFKPQRT